MRKQKDKGVFSKKNMIGIFIALIMIMSGVGYMVTQDTGTGGVDYNGYRFTGGYNEWYTNVGGKTVRFTYHPEEVNMINISPEIVSYLQNTQMVYVTFDPLDESIQEIELARNQFDMQLPEHFNVYPVTGVTNASDLYKSFSIVDCGNSTMFVPVIKIRTVPENPPQIYAEGACIIIQAQNPRDIIILKDRLMYSMFKIL